MSSDAETGRPLGWGTQLKGLTDGRVQTICGDHVSGLMALEFHMICHLTPVAQCTRNQGDTECLGPIQQGALQGGSSNTAARSSQEATGGGLVPVHIPNAIEVFTGQILDA
tara:strand:+ start:593 stop:925 length:333 start_codon:yes stop_codon:yes gene_type:complete